MILLMFTAITKPLQNLLRLTNVIVAVSKLGLTRVKKSSYWVSLNSLWLSGAQ